MKVSVLVENNLCETADNKEDLKAIHGLSLYIESGERKILFDTGMDKTLISNSEAMGIDLREVDTVIVSHGHLDHGGGLKHFFPLNPEAHVFMHKEAGEPHYSKRLAGLPVPIGLSRSVLRSNRDKIKIIEKTTELAPGIKIYEGIPRDFPQPETNNNLCRKEGKAIVPDDFNHEIVLSIEEMGKLYIFTGCSHSGIINMVNLVKRENPGKEIEAVFGGFHIFSPGKKTGVSSQYLEKLIRELEAFGTVFYTGHCTGESNYQLIREKLGNKVKAMNTGLVFSN